MSEINLSGTPATPDEAAINEAMVWVSEATGGAWRCRRLGAIYHFVRPDGITAQSRRRDFRAAVAEVTGLDVIR